MLIWQNNLFESPRLLWHIEARLFFLPICPQSTTCKGHQTPRTSAESVHADDSGFYGLYYLHPVNVHGHIASSCQPILPAAIWNPFKFAKCFNLPEVSTPMPNTGAHVWFCQIEWRDFDLCVFRLADDVDYAFGHMKLSEFDAAPIRPSSRTEMVWAHLRSCRCAKGPTHLPQAFQSLCCEDKSDHSDRKWLFLLGVPIGFQKH